MRVTLINSRSEKSTSMCLPRNILCLGGALDAHGHEVQLLDLILYSPDEICEKVRAFDPDMVGISVMTLNFAVGRALMRRIQEELARSSSKKIYYCAGGIQATILPFETISQMGLDFVCVAEGDETLPAICDSFKTNGRLDLSQFKGVAYLSDKGEKVYTRPPLVNLENLPLPAYHLIDFERYMMPPGWIRGRILTRTAQLYMNRGCPYGCTYCNSAAMYQRRVRRQSVAKFMREVDLLIDSYHIQGFCFADETFSLDRKWTMEVLKEIKKRRIIWSCSTRVDRVDDELLRLMRDAGCIQADFGVESGSPRVLKLMNRAMTTEDIREGFRLCKKHGIRPFAQVMVGMPTETWDDVKMTVRLLKEIRPVYSMVSIFTPFPESEVYRQEKEKIGKVDNYLEKLYNYELNTSDRLLVNVSAMTDQEVLNARTHISRSTALYNYGNMITGRHLVFAAQALWYACLKPAGLMKALLKTLRFGRPESLVYFLVINYYHFETKKAAATVGGASASARAGSSQFPWHQKKAPRP